MKLFSVSSAGIALLLAAFVPAAGFAAEDDPIPRTAAIRDVFKPFETDIASIAPDGKHLAFEKHVGEQLFLAIVDLSNNQVMELPLVSDVPALVSGVKEKIPSRITYLAWPTSDRVVACVRGDVLVAVDADGRNFKQLLGIAEMRDETRGLDRRTTDTRNYLVDPATGQIISTQGGREILRGPSGDPIDSSVKDPELVRIGDTLAMRSGEGASLTEVGTTSDSVTMDLFDSINQAGPASGLRPHVLELLPDDPDHILVEIRGLVGPLDDVAVQESGRLRSTVMKVNIRTGAAKEHVDEFFTTRILVDKQGKPRGTLRQVGTERTLHLSAKPGGRLVPYRDVLGSIASGFELTPKNLLGERSIPLGFDYNPDIFFYASNIGRDTYAIRAVDLAKQKDTGLLIEHPAYDFATPTDVLPQDILVFDRHARKLAGIRLTSLRNETLWIDRDLALIQQSMVQQSKGMNVEIVEWAADRSRFLVKMFDESNPGAFYIYDAAQKRVLEYARRAPSIAPAMINASRPFDFKTPSGTRLTGYFTMPRHVRVSPLPVLIYCHDGPWSRDMPGYDRGAQALATMGFAVLQVNYRGSAGFGRAHLEALRDKGEKVALEDIIAALDLVQGGGLPWIKEGERLSTKRVAILGNGYGGYLALRAMQEFPDRFRCAVSINAPSNLVRWLGDTDTAFSFNGGIREAFFGTNTKALTASSPALNGKPFRGPVLVVQSNDDKVVPERHAREIRRVLDGVESHYLEVQGEGHARWLPGTYVKVFDELEAFFTTYIYSYRVDVGQEKEVPDPKDSPGARK